MFGSPVIYDGGQQRLAVPGDVVQSNDSIVTVNNAAGITYTAQQMLNTLISRTGVGAGQTDTTADATSWISALLQNQYQGGGATTPLGIPVGTTYRFKIINGAANAITMAAGTNVTLVAGPGGASNVPASASADFVATVLNGTPSQLYAGNTTNGSAVVTGMTALQTLNLSPGMAVTGTGIAGGTTIASVQPGVGVTLSANATATNNQVALTFSPRMQVQRIA